jgi:hypothetical protein
MGYKFMQPVSINTQNQTQRAFEHKEELSAASSSDWIIVPDDIRGVSVSVSASGGATARAETTTSLYKDVISDTAQPETWPSGEVTTITSQNAHPCTAIRLVQTGAGSSIMTLRAQ